MPHGTKCSKSLAAYEELSVRSVGDTVPQLELDPPPRVPPPRPGFMSFLEKIPIPGSGAAHMPVYNGVVPASRTPTSPRLLVDVPEHRRPQPTETRRPSMTAFHL